MNTLSPNTAALKKEILAENRRVHAREGAFYLARHPEQTNWFIDRVRKKALRRLCARMRGTRVLDLGCGTGYLYLDLWERGFRMTGVDLSPDMLEVLKRRVPDPARSKLVQADVETFLQTTAESYDAIVCSALLHHLYDHTPVIRQAVHRLNPGGVLLIFFEPLRQKIHSRLGYLLHRILARMDETWYRQVMRWKQIPVFEEDYRLSDYQRRFGGIDPALVRCTLEAAGAEILEMKTCCARRYGAFAWIATHLLQTHNTFYLLARKNPPPPGKS